MRDAPVRVRGRARRNVHHAFARYVISVANARARWLQGERSASLGLAAQLGGLEGEPSTAALAGAVKVKAKKDKAGTLFAGKKTNYSAAATTFQPEADPRDDSDDDDYAAGAAPAAAALGDGATCALRVEVDADAYPPQSAARAEFLDAFARDVAEALDDDAFSYEGEAEPLRVAPADVRVLGLAPAPELDWMCLVEFELFPGGGGDEKSYEAADRATTRGAAVRKLAALVKDADSPLYEGDVACFVDRDFTAGLFGVEEAAPAKAEAPLSPDPAVAAVLARYDAARAPPSHAKPGCVPPPFGSGRGGARRDDVTFTVYVTYKGLRKPLQVLNPTKCRRVKCWVWPHDVLAALGLGRGVAGPWTAARALKPTTLGGRAVTAQLATEIPFLEVGPPAPPGIPRLRALQASRLHAGSDYELVVDDSRMDAFDRISPSERADLEAKLAAMPGAVDDGAPAAALAADFKARCAAHAEALDAKLARLVEDGEEDGEGGDVSLTDAEIAAAEALHKAHARRIKDADRRFADLVDHAAVNGTVSKMDAALLEVAWIQTTLDPAKIKLF